LEGLLKWGIEVVLWFQQASPSLDLFFKCLTFLGDEEFFLIFLPFFYWCADRRTGARLLVVFLISAYLNSAAKVLAGQPRPFQMDERVRAITSEMGGGLPSGHTQSAVVLWGYLAYCFRHKLLWVVAGFVIIAVPLSRIYLGVHFPTDILGGYVLGGIVLVGFLWLAPRVESRLISAGFGRQIGMAIIFPGFLVLLGFLVGPNCLTAGSTLLGFCSGMAIERRWINFKTGGIWWKQAVRYLAGLFILVCLWLGLKLGFNGLEPESVFRVIRYTLVGIWCSLGAPWLFLCLNLAEKEDKIANSGI
jgi:membrane-associated phospholipid phosphatase